MSHDAPTLDEIRAWPAICEIPDFARATRMSRSGAYELAKTGRLPVRVIRVGRRYRVVTASLIALLSGQGQTGAGEAEAGGR